MQKPLVTSKTPTYITWQSMKQRCFDPNQPGWHNYGGRGITVCDRWLKFKNFLEDMGERPHGKQIDRIDNNGNYTKENCRWVTRSENRRNQRPVAKAAMVGSEHYATKLTEENVMSIRRTYSEGVKSLSQLAKEWSLAPATVQDMVKGRTWKHLPTCPPPPRKKYQPKGA